MTAWILLSLGHVERKNVPCSILPFSKHLHLPGESPLQLSYTALSALNVAPSNKQVAISPGPATSHQCPHSESSILLICRTTMLGFSLIYTQNEYHHPVGKFRHTNCKLLISTSWSRAAAGLQCFSPQLGTGGSIQTRFAHATCVMAVQAKTL